MGHPAPRETITSRATGEGRIKRTTERRHEYAHVRIELDPLPLGSGTRFEDAVTLHGVIPERFLAPLELGILDALRLGPIAGFEVTDCTATVVDGSYHEIDSTPAAFRAAAQMATATALQNAKTALLLPMMDLVLNCREEFAGSIMAEINSSLGSITGISPGKTRVQISAKLREVAVVDLLEALADIAPGTSILQLSLSAYERASQAEAADALSGASICGGCRRHVLQPIKSAASLLCPFCGQELEPPEPPDSMVAV